MKSVREMEADAARYEEMSSVEKAEHDEALQAHQVALGLVFPFPAPWRPISEAVKDNRLYLLIVDYGEDTNAEAVQRDAAEGYVVSANALEDEWRYGRTIGGNGDDNVGEDEGSGWQFAGWCWSHDHFTEGHGTPVACIELDAIAPMAVQP